MISTLVEFLKKKIHSRLKTVGMYCREKKKRERWENANEKIVEKEISNL